MGVKADPDNALDRLDNDIAYCDILSYDRFMLLTLSVSNISSLLVELSWLKRLVAALKLESVVCIGDNDGLFEVTGGWVLDSVTLFACDERDNLRMPFFNDWSLLIGEVLCCESLSAGLASLVVRAAMEGKM